MKLSVKYAIIVKSISCTEVVLVDCCPWDPGDSSWNGDIACGGSGSSGIGY
jgi:hypothetical protein